MISGSLAVEGPPRGLGLSVPGHHLTHHPPPSFVTYHQPTPSSSGGGVSHPYHHSGLTHHPSVVDSATAAAAWNSMRAAMVSSQHQSSASVATSSQASSVASSMPSHPTNSQQKQSEFLMPLPKPLSTRYNGGLSSANLSGSNLNGLRSSSSGSTRSSKYSPPAAATVTNSPNNGPVNLVQHNKEDNTASGPGAPSSLPPTQEELYQSAAAAYARIYVPQSFSYGGLAGAAGPYGPTLYGPPPYTPLIARSALEQTSFNFQPQHVYSNPTNQRSSLERLSSSAVQSPEIVVKSPKDVNKLIKFQQPSATVTSGETFKVPSGKEGSLKHRILTRPSPGSVGNISANNSGSDNSSILSSKKHLTVSSSSISSSPGSIAANTAATITTAPHSQTTTNINNNTIIPVGFGKDSLICLGNGELKRVEDMRTEDFVLSAQQCPELRLADSTVVRIQEIPKSRHARITLSYNQNRTQVEIETLLEHPLFIYGQGWASCVPERTLQCFGLKCHQLQVGDICITLMPRENNPSSTSVSSSIQKSMAETQHFVTGGGGSSSRSITSKSQTITTTATTTAMTTRQISPKTTVTSSGGTISTTSTQFMLNQPQRTHSAEEVAAIEASNARKRRWSAPDDICDDDLPHTPRRHKE